MKMKLPSLPFSKLEIIAWLIALVRAFLYSLIVTGTAAQSILRVTPYTGFDADDRLLFWISLFIVQAGVMLAFLDSTLSKLAAKPPMRFATLGPKVSPQTETSVEP